MKDHDYTDLVEARFCTSPSSSASAEMCGLESDQNDPKSLATQFNAFGKVAAEQIILRGTIVARAMATFEYKAFQEFCRFVKLKPKSSTCRKYKLIGSEADWLEPIAAHLPGDWTTIYDVTRLGQTKANELIGLGTLHPQATAKDLKAAKTVKASKKTGTAEPCVFGIVASDLSDPERLSLFRNLEEIAAKHGLTVTGLPKRLAERSIIEREAA